MVKAVEPARGGSAVIARMGLSCARTHQYVMPEHVALPCPAASMGQLERMATVEDNEPQTVFCHPALFFNVVGARSKCAKEVCQETFEEGEPVDANDGRHSSVEDKMREVAIFLMDCLGGLHCGVYRAEIQFDEVELKIREPKRGVFGVGERSREVGSLRQRLGTLF